MLSLTDTDGNVSMSSSSTTSHALTFVTTCLFSGTTFILKIPMILSGFSSLFLIIFPMLSIHSTFDSVSFFIPQLLLWVGFSVFLYDELPLSLFAITLSFVMLNKVSTVQVSSTSFLSASLFFTSTLSGSFVLFHFHFLTQNSSLHLELF